MILWEGADKGSTSGNARQTDTVARADEPIVVANRAPINACDGQEGKTRGRLRHCERRHQARSLLLMRRGEGRQK